jgi:hypothetical protein
MGRFLRRAENVWEFGDGQPIRSLRKAVRIVNQTLAELQIEQHPDKTFVGRTKRGFSFLGYEFDAAGLAGIALPTRERFVERIHRLYEQGATASRIGEYVRRWLIWIKSGLPCSVSDSICGRVALTMPHAVYAADCDWQSFLRRRTPAAPNANKASPVAVEGSGTAEGPI